LKRKKGEKKGKAVERMAGLVGVTGVSSGKRGGKKKGEGD